jgi:hypothetical protein
MTQDLRCNDGARLGIWVAALLERISSACLSQSPAAKPFKSHKAASGDSSGFVFGTLAAKLKH